MHSFTRSSIESENVSEFLFESFSRSYTAELHQPVPCVGSERVVESEKDIIKPENSKTFNMKIKLTCCKIKINNNIRENILMNLTRSFCAKTLCRILFSLFFCDVLR